ncbi:MAG: hypothetical protein NVS4B12_27470 [Ktedonobacteraceae bacterium]
MSGLYITNAGGIFVAGYGIGGGTIDEFYRRVHLMIYQLASYMNAKDHGATIQNAAKQVLGGEPQPNEVQMTPIDGNDPIIGYFATDIRLNNAQDQVLAVGINPAETYDPQQDPNRYYLMDVQDLSIVLTVLQLIDRADNLTADQPIFNAALAALKAISDQLEDRAERQGWAPPPVR